MTESESFEERHMAVDGSHETVMDENRPWTCELVRWSKDVLAAVLGAIVIVIFVVQPVKVAGISMEPEIQPQDRLLVNKFGYYFSDIGRGDIVVFWSTRDESQSFIKRVVGLPGDRIEIRSGVVFVNEKRLSEPYLVRQLGGESHPVEVVSSQHYFVLGDHRNSSSDSRDWGSVPEQNIFGEAVFRYWPLEKMGRIE